MDSFNHTAYLSLGSNINPVENLRKAVALLRMVGQVTQISSIWETEAVGSKGPNFLNTGLVYETPYSQVTLKDLVLHRIEVQLGRVRSADKNAPRPIDLDIVVFDGQVIDSELWSRLHIARPFAEIIPELVNPVTGLSLKDIADQLHCHGCAIPHPEISL